MPGHNWTDAIAMATPVAHKGATAGAKALAYLEQFGIKYPTVRAADGSCGSSAVP